ncbi:MAG: Ig-like domain-containing protein [Anaerolinea sp.]|nr:Ig-like domain-containing protein [Anaerolinea sp.]
MSKKPTWIYFICMWLWLAMPLHAQNDATLKLSLRRDFGYGNGANIQGTFSFRIDGPDNLQRVVFFIDDTAIGSDTEAPFRLQFKTDNYALGVHTLSAVGYTHDGQEINSNRITRNFVSASEAGNFLIWIIVPLLILSLGGRMVVAWLANRGRREADKPILSGPLGGTICARCKRPFAIHLWSLRLVTFRIDRCPHCGKWQHVQRMPDELLQTAVAAATEAAAKAAQPHTADPDETAKQRRQLDDSRFEN